MDRINGEDTVDIGGGRRGFQPQNAAAGIPGTEVTAAYLNSVQEEIMAIIEKAGLTADPNDWSQLWQALNKLTLPGYRGVLNWLAVKAIDVTAPPSDAQTGDTYLVPDNATGNWQAHKGQIAVRDDVGWIYITPKDGHGFGLPAGDVYIRCNGVYQPKIALDVQSGKWLFGVAAGSGDALTVNLDPPVTRLSDGLTIKVGFDRKNTAGTTINLNGLGPKKIFKATNNGVVPLSGNEMQAGGIYSLVFNSVLDSNGGWFFASPSQDDGSPTGKVDMFAMQTVPPEWVPCDGRLLGRGSFQNLFNVIGTIWGSTDDNNFAVPNYNNGMFLRGWSENQTVDAGRKFAELQQDDFKKHDHGGNTDPEGGHDHDYSKMQRSGGGPDGTGNWGTYDNVSAKTSYVAPHRHKIPTEGGSETRPVNQTVVYAIKT